MTKTASPYNVSRFHSRDGMTEYLTHHPGFHRENDFVLSWKFGPGCPDFSEDRYQDFCFDRTLDRDWRVWLENHPEVYWQAYQYFRNEIYVPLSDEDTLDRYEFTIAMGDDIHLLLTRWPHPVPQCWRRYWTFEIHSPLSWEDREAYRGWVVTLGSDALRTFYRLVVRLDTDLSDLLFILQESLAYYRVDWEETQHRAVCENT